MYKKIFLIGLLVLASLPTHAAGPSRVAAPQSDLWPESVNSTEAFDRASRAHILVFARELAASELLSDKQLATTLKIKHVDHRPLDAIRTKFWQRLASNYAMATAHCRAGEDFCTPAADADALRKVAAALDSPPAPRYQAWFTDAQSFHRTYLDELLRLAALFPRTSSEVDTFSLREISGNELPDRHFLLTFDDGPTRAGGDTDQTLAMLRALHMNAIFFTLGGNLQARLHQRTQVATANDYAGMCVGSHGWEHKPHSTWPQWRDSVTRSVAQVRDSLPDSFTPLFRPPYGQRLPDSGSFFDAHDIRVTLWNIDSQDWNSKVDADQVKQRVLALMLLWRHGIVLFHDIHPKAQVAVPWIMAQTRDAGIQWIDCHGFPAP
ncbi:polysaccharide deacetylase family protein [Dyella sp.]|uniref:polysaccharide deacetylase family protein n=1 Tax=Dyella sp. TaxID=1869338 RepID=UPI002ED5BF84